MIGEDYFELRAKLGTALYALARLGETLRLDPERVALLENLITGLKEPLLFVVAGEVNSGKSTFLNGLFGEELCETAALPKTSKIHYFRYGDEQRDVDVSDTLVELHRPCAFLKDFHIVDTPGTNSIAESHEEITERFIPMADLVIFVFSVTNPWGAANWRLLERIHHKWFKNIAFVLQQCDLRAEEEVQAIVEHMRVTAQRRLGTSFPIFCVSAKKALLAKTTGVDKERLWGESRFEELEAFTSQAVANAESRQQRINNTAKTAQVILGDVRVKMRDGVETLHADGQLLERLERAVSKQKILTGGKFLGLFEAFDNEYMTLGIESGEYLEGRLTIGASIRSLFREDEAPRQVQENFSRNLGWSIRERVGGAAETVRVDLKRLWQGLNTHIAENYDYALPSADKAGLEHLQAATEALVTDTENRVVQDLSELGIAAGLRKDFAARRRMIRAILFLALLASGCAVGTAIAGMSPYHLVCIGMAVVSLLAAGVYANRNAADITQKLGSKLEENRELLDRNLRGVFDAGIDQVFREFLKLFQPLRDLCQSHRDKYEPQIEQIEQLAQTFRHIEHGVPGVEATRDVLAERI